jgi:predicted permease
MTLLSRLRSWLSATLLRPRLEAEMDAELRFHLESYADDLIRTGVPRQEALRRARLEFGGVERAKEECREARGVNLTETLIQDVRVGTRALLRTRGVSAVCIFVLALGIGSSTALYSVWKAALVFPYAFEHNGRWVAVLARLNRQDTQSWFFSVAEYNDLRKLTNIFESVAALQHVTFNLTDNDHPEQLRATAVTANTIADTGVAPMLGRSFLAGEDAPGGPNVVLISSVLWQRRYFGDPAIVGKQMRMNGENYTVIGVMPPRYQMWGTQMWVPLRLDQNDRDRSRRVYWVTAMLKNGVRGKHADAALAVVARQWEQAAGSRTPEYASLWLWTEDVLKYVDRPLTNAMLILLAAIVLLLLITCANVANLLLARAASRRREVAIRLALGGGRLRIVRQFLTESFILSIIGGACGFLLAWRSMPWISGMIVDYVSTEAGKLELDSSALAFTLLLSLAVGLLYGVAPAFQATKVSLVDTLKEGGRNVGGARQEQWTRKSLVVAEIGLALMVLVAAGLMIQSYSRLAGSDVGFDRTRVLQTTISLPPNSYPAKAQMVSFFRELDQSVSALPGVEASALVSSVPVYDRLDKRDFQIEGRAADSGDARGSAICRVVTPGIFRVLKIPLRSGRVLNDDDREEGLRVAVVNETFASRYWPKQNPVGKQIELGNQYSEQLTGGATRESPRRIAIVGVVGDTRQSSDWSFPIIPEMYLPYAQSDDSVRSMSLLVRSGEAPAELLGSLRGVVRQLDTALPLTGAHTMEEIVDDAYGTARLTWVLLSVFAGVALLLAVAGVYALLAYTVSQRSHEIGIRMALGALPRQVLQQTLAQAAKLAVLGVAIGIPLLLAHAMSALLYQVKATDPLTYLGTAILLLSLALVGCYVPARRAMRVDPMVALRHE